LLKERFGRGTVTVRQRILLQGKKKPKIVKIPVERQNYKIKKSKKKKND